MVTHSPQPHLDGGYTVFGRVNEKDMSVVDKIVRGDIIEPVKTGEREHDILETTRLYTAEIERIIRQYPDQWLWIHKRWKTRPKGEPGLY